jgi:hypothetical protein
MLFCFTVHKELLVADTLNQYQLRVIQEVVAAAKADDPDKKMTHMSNAAWFVKQETDRLIAEEVNRSAFATTPL